MSSKKTYLNCINRFFLLLFLCSTITKAQVVLGKVIDSQNGKPIEDAFIYFMPTSKTISTFRVSDSLGHFVLLNPKSKVFYLKVSRLGYQDIFVGKLRISQNDTLGIIIEMTAVPILLKEIEITGNKPLEEYDSELVDVGFYRRKNFGDGKFFTYKDFKNRAIGHLSELFYGIPGIMVSNRQVISTRSPSLSRSSGNMLIYIDGMLVENEAGSSFSPLDMVSPNYVKAIEVYKNGIIAPMQYSRGRPNGVILIWTGIFNNSK